MAQSSAIEQLSVTIADMDRDAKQTADMAEQTAGYTAKHFTNLIDDRLEILYQLCRGICQN